MTWLPVTLALRGTMALPSTPILTTVDRDGSKSRRRHSRTTCSLMTRRFAVHRMANTLRPAASEVGALLGCFLTARTKISCAVMAQLVGAASKVMAVMSIMRMMAEHDERGSAAEEELEGLTRLHVSSQAIKQSGVLCDLQTFSDRLLVISAGGTRAGCCGTLSCSDSWRKKE